jgi:hypothetical protein
LIWLIPRWWWFNQTICYNISKVKIYTYNLFKRSYIFPSESTFYPLLFYFSFTPSLRETAIKEAMWIIMDSHWHKMPIIISTVKQTPPRAKIIQISVFHSHNEYKHDKTVYLYLGATKWRRGLCENDQSHCDSIKEVYL